MKITILISKNSWAEQYKLVIKKTLAKYCKNINFISDHKKIKNHNDINIIFSYFKFIESAYLKKSKYNLIPHESNLPSGKGMSPLTWQILQGKQNFVFSLIEASEKYDCGDIYFKKKVKIPKHFIFNEIKSLQLFVNLSLVIKFLKKFKKNKIVLGKKQSGRSTYYLQRTPKDHKINIYKTLKSQFNLLRTSDNKAYPAFFEYRKNKFMLKIKKI